VPHDLPGCLVEGSSEPIWAGRTVRRCFLDHHGYLNRSERRDLVSEVQLRQAQLIEVNAMFSGEGCP
jgi:hypothetical protein